MTADQLIQYLSWAVFVLLFVLVLFQAIRRPYRAQIDIALLFSVPVLIIAVAIADALGLVEPRGVWDMIAATGLISLPYLLLQLIDDVVVVPVHARRAVAILLGAAAAAIWLLPLDHAPWLNGLLLLDMIGVFVYVVVASIRATLGARGVTRRRLAAMSAGSLFLVLNIAIGSFNLWLPDLAGLWRAIADVAGLATGVCYFLGFAPPRSLRRAWQEPELRAFLGRAATLPRLPDTQAILQALEQGTATATGVSRASIGLWSESAQAIQFGREDGPFNLDPNSAVPSARAFRMQQPIFSPATRYDEPALAHLNLSAVTQAVLAAPITAGARRLGVLVVYAPRAPIFADDDLALVQLMADQAAVILESRTLIDEAAQVRARDEAARLKEDFLSAAAHDLKTPLTTLIARAQLLERRAQRDPSAPADRASIQMMVSEGKRLKRLVLALLDATRVEQGQLVVSREQVDLVGIARAVCERHHSVRHRCIVEAGEQVIGWFDALRIEQLLENLVENAIKYSPDGGLVKISVRQMLDSVEIEVVDHGIGIPAAELPQLFARFHRGANIDDRRFPGMGLGLFICKGIVEQHGGQIVATSRVGQGTIFHITLPQAAAEPAMNAA